MGMYRPIVVVDSTAYLSGHGPVQADGSLVCGRLGDDLDVAAGHFVASSLRPLRRIDAVLRKASIRFVFGSS